MQSVWAGAAGIDCEVEGAGGQAAIKTGQDGTAHAQLRKQGEGEQSVLVGRCTIGRAGRKLHRAYLCQRCRQLAGDDVGRLVRLVQLCVGERGGGEHGQACSRFDCRQAHRPLLGLGAQPCHPSQYVFVLVGKPGASACNLVLSIGHCQSMFELCCPDIGTWRGAGPWPVALPRTQAILAIARQELVREILGLMGHFVPACFGFTSAHILKRWAPDWHTDRSAFSACLSFGDFHGGELEVQDAPPRRPPILQVTSTRPHEA